VDSSGPSPEPTSPARRDPSPPPWTDVEPDSLSRPPRYEPVTEPVSPADEAPLPEEDVVTLSSDPSRPPTPPPLRRSLQGSGGPGTSDIEVPDSCWLTVAFS